MIIKDMRMDEEEELAYHVQQAVREFSLAMQATSRTARLAHLQLVAEHSSAAQVLRTALVQRKNITADSQPTQKSGI